MSDTTCAWFSEFFRSATLKHGTMGWPSLLATLEASDPDYKN
jgi:hypothetical protein